jgi:hypothetical protein
MRVWVGLDRVIQLDAAQGFAYLADVVAQLAQVVHVGRELA